MIRSFNAAAALALLLCTACNSGPATSDEQDFTESDPATIVFDAEFGENVDGDLVEGGLVVLEYDAERVSQCVAQQGGVPQYAVTAYYSLDGSEPETIVVAGLNADAEPTIELESAGELEIWFEVTNRWGCHEWDSDFGNNYRFDVSAEE